jgi:predicted 3-demethylubiquinone-9 3-methyltransferase (glyoxalase superfamily)
MGTTDKLTPCLWFDKQGLEAAEFYVSLFKNSQITDVSHYPDGTPMMVAFELDGRPYTALNGGPEYTLNEAFSISISCDGQDEVDEYWDKLIADGGEPGRCAWLKDRFGVSWQVVPIQLMQALSDPDPGRSQRAMQAMMGMSKIDIAELQRAADAG